MMHHVSDAADKGREVERTFTIAARIGRSSSVFGGLTIAFLLGAFLASALLIPALLCLIAHVFMDRESRRWEKRAHAELAELQADLRRLHERAR